MNKFSYALIILALTGFMLEATATHAASKTDRPKYQSEVTAVASHISSNSRIGDVKSLPNGAVVDLLGKIITAKFESDGVFYVEEEDRSSAIRILGSTSAVVGQKVNITSGQMDTRVINTKNSERQIKLATITPQATGFELAPLAMKSSTLGGGFLNPLTPGVKDGLGINSIGLLVRFTGRVGDKAATDLWLNDGGGIVDPSGRQGVLVKCPDASIPVQVGDYIRVTGILEGSIPAGETYNRRQIRIRNYNDIYILHSTGPGAISGTVKYGVTGIVGATVATTTGGYSTTTGAGGSYTLTNITPGTYSVVASNPGYSTSTQAGKLVSAGATTTVNFTLSPNIINGSFENGFTSGVGNSWTSFQSGNFSPSFSDGTDQFSDGAHAQKITLPQPSSTDKYAGIRQTISTSIGAPYTISVKARGNIPTETYAGEDLVIRLGYDLTGGTVFTSENVNWQEFDSTKNLWHTLNRTFTATGSSTTIYLQAWRKWAQHGTGYVWFDSVICTGGNSPGTISGTVKDASNNAINGATVSTTTGGYTTTTNSSGVYSLPNITPGTYTVVASKPGYNSSTQAGKTVSAGATTTVNFTLVALPPGNGTISGYVRDGCYHAISGAIVSTSPGGYSTTTNASGAYTLTGVASGVYNVSASKATFQTHTFHNKQVVSNGTTTLNYQLPVSHSKFGWHSVIGPRDGFGPFLAATAGCGKPLAVMKGVDDLGALAEVKSYSSRTITIGRYAFYNGVDYNNLAGNGWTTSKTPQEAADIAYPIMKAVWLTHPEVDVWEIVNEWNSDYTWQSDYMIAMMNKAEPDGFRLGLFSSSGGTPSENDYADVARACARAKASGGHVLCLHEYGFFGNGLLSGQNSSLVTRYRQLYTYLEQHDSEVPILLTEVGQGGGYVFVGDEAFKTDHAWYDAQVRQDSYILGVCAWTLGNWLNANAYTAIDEMQTYICNN